MLSGLRCVVVPMPCCNRQVNQNINRCSRPYKQELFHQHGKLIDMPVLLQLLTLGYIVLALLVALLDV